MMIAPLLRDEMEGDGPPRHPPNQSNLLYFNFRLATPTTGRRHPSRGISLRPGTPKEIGGRSGGSKELPKDAGLASVGEVPADEWSDLREVEILLGVLDELLGFLFREAVDGDEMRD